MQVNGSNSGPNSIAVTGIATGPGSLGIEGKGDGSGVRGEGTTWHGIVGVSRDGFGVYGTAQGSGIVGESVTWMGVYGTSKSTTGGAGVMGEAIGPGVIGKSQTWHGVYGETQSTTGGAGVWGEHKGSGVGVVGKSASGVGVWGTSDSNEALHAETNSPDRATIAAYNQNPGATGAAIFAKKVGNMGHAGFFDGDVHVTRNITCGGDVSCVGADCAEEFPVDSVAQAPPGSVMVIGENGVTHPCNRAYDRRVVGVVSGAGAHRPAMVLDRQGGADRRPIALVGKVFCLVDASFGKVQVGDLLTTSATPGYAMRAEDPARLTGAVIGKALGDLDAGYGLVPILVNLQ
jgi:hypothetical protein